MFKTGSGFLNLVLNFLIAAGLFFFFRAIGWINIDSALSIWLIVLIAGVVNIVTGLLAGLVALVISVVLGVISVCSLVLALPVIVALISYFTLFLTGRWTGLFTLTTVWWQAILLGLAFAIFQFRTSTDN